MIPRPSPAALAALAVFAVPAVFAEIPPGGGASGSAAVQDARTSFAKAVPSAVAKGIVSFYKRAVAPAIGARCALEPSCSAYFLQAARKHGFFGVPMIADRFVREPVVSAPGRPWIQNAAGEWRHPDPVEDHDWWFAGSEGVEANAEGRADPDEGKEVRDVGGRIRKHASLAEDFLGSGDFSAAAAEWRRAEAECDRADFLSRGSFFLAAADAYREAGEWNRMDRMLSRVESDAAMREAFEGETAFLRMRRAEGRRDWADAAEWAETLSELRRDPAEADAAMRIADSDWVLAGSPRPGAPVPARKSPRLGGLLGLVPGLGYAYSGEWGNAVRSLLLNSLFGWAMYETAERDQWAVFGVVSFFELTWYTGSVYGGTDAAHRYNRERAEEAARAVRGGAEPALRRTPAGAGLFRVNLEF